IAQITDFWLGRDRVLSLAAAPGLVAAGDPVFYRQADGSWLQVGYIERVQAGGESASAVGSQAAVNATREATVQVRWHDRRIDPQALRLTAHRNRGTLTEMTQIMFPPKKRAVVGQLIAEAMQQHGDVLVERFMPLVEQSVRQSLPVVEI